MRNTRLESTFPNLRGTGYEITSLETPRYNCVAWAAGFSNRWWWPTPGYYWPGENLETSVTAFERTFAALGFTVCESGELELGFEKVALYAKESLPCHMARQLPDGKWTSKCGPSFDITHALCGLQGEHYGEVVLVMRRRKNTGAL